MFNSGFDEVGQNEKLLKDISCSFGMGLVQNSIAVPEGSVCLMEHSWTARSIIASSLASRPCCLVGTGRGGALLTSTPEGRILSKSGLSDSFQMQGRPLWAL